MAISKFIGALSKFIRALFIRSGKLAGTFSNDQKQVYFR